MAEHSTPFTRWLNAAMDARSLTQADVARKLLINDSQVSRWRRGVGAPNLYYVERLAEEFGATREYLAELVGLATSKPAESMQDIDPEIVALVEAERQELQAELRNVPRVFWPAIIQARRFATRAATDVVRLTHEAASGATSTPESGATSTPVEPTSRTHSGGKKGRNSALPYGYLATASV